jgi:probable F420-dependent oxidoreductase
MMIETRDDIAPQDLARAVEARGFESLFFPEHSHIPTSRETIRMGQKELPAWYSHVPDPFVSCAAAAVATERIKIGTCICLIPEHDPILLAKSVATIDRLSGGRFLFGIGAGWNAEELRDHGVAFEDRWTVTRERILAMREIWTQDAAEYHGEFVDFPPMWCWPKPIQPGGPPILLGAQSRWSPKRVANYCDGWMPSLMVDPDEFGAMLGNVQNEWQAAGRDLATLDLTIWGVQTREAAQQARALGANRIVFRLDTDSAATLGADLDAYWEIGQTLS